MKRSVVQFDNLPKKGRVLVVIQVILGDPDCEALVITMGPGNFFAPDELAEFVYVV